MTINVYVPRAGLSYCGFIWPPPLFNILAWYRRFFTKSSLRFKPPEQTGAIQSVCECMCVHLWPGDVYLCTARVHGCFISRADSYRQCSSLTALLYSDCHPWRKTHLRRKSFTVFLTQTHTHTITASSDSLGVSLTHTSVIHVSQFSAAGLNVLYIF